MSTSTKQEGLTCNALHTLRKQVIDRTHSPLQNRGVQASEEGDVYRSNDLAPLGESASGSAWPMAWMDCKNMAEMDIPLYKNNDTLKKQLQRMRSKRDALRDSLNNEQRSHSKSMSALASTLNKKKRS